LGFAEMYLNDVNVEKLELLEVSSFVSKATIAEVMQKLVEQQQEMGKKRNCMDRDIGTVVFSRCRT
jgi:cytidylate kinase